MSFVILEGITIPYDIVILNSLCSSESCATLDGDIDGVNNEDDEESGFSFPILELSENDNGENAKNNTTMKMSIPHPTTTPCRFSNIFASCNQDCSLDVNVVIVVSSSSSCDGDDGDA